MNRTILTVPAATLVGLIASLGLEPAARGQELYMMQTWSEPTLFRIDGPTGQILDAKPILGATEIGRGLAARWDRQLFTTALDEQGASHLFRIDPDTGEGVLVAAPLAVPVITMAADPNTGRLYGTQVKDLYQIDHKTGAMTFIGNIGVPELFAQVFAMAIGRDGVGYVTDMYNNNLCKVDLATADSEFVCQLGSQNWYNDMGFDANGSLWAVLAWDGGVRRAEIDPCKTTVLYTDWYVDGVEVVPAGTDCYSDCNLDDSLDLFDFLCFVNAFNASDEKADCNGDAKFDVFDFLCFVNNFNAGC